jgi:pimeloyl-ACP methyl ester carboxylesterase
MHAAGVLRIAAGVMTGALAVLALSPSTAARAVQSARPGSCQGADIPVSAVLPTFMHGTLCLPARGRPSTVMALIPGATYNHTYWDFPYKPQTYNFRRAMNAAGYATFVVDRLGTGQSSRPLSALVTSSLQADAVHRSIQVLRSGGIGGIRFSRVIVAGHSLGSGIAILEAVTYKDVDGVLLTGYGHSLNPLPLAGLFLSFYPAAADPQLRASGYDPGYLTTRPGLRGPDFYAPATTHANVVATDEATKDVWSPVTEGVDGLGFSVVVSVTYGISVPVMIANGAADDTLCIPLTHNCATSDAFRAQEAPFFNKAACLQTYLLPGSGHAVNLASDAPAYHQAVRAWADALVGRGPDTAARSAGSCPS